MCSSNEHHPDVQASSKMQKTVLMNAMAWRLKQARDNLSIGWHNPELMEEIEFIHGALKLITNFETKLVSELDDVD